MKLEVLFFASLREALGRSREAVELPPGVGTVAALREYLCARGAEWTALQPARTLRAAVNQEMVPPGHTLRDGDEVAFFPPVTGG
jgi:molybdopterin synthase sulfur carrier subunit